MESSVKNLPSLPGVYLFKSNNKIIYVGKAKNIKKRVRTYFSNQHKDWKINALLLEHTHIDHIVTHSENDALLLEAQLIRDNKPKFNVLLKSGQPFLYLLFTKAELPTIEVVRTKKKKGAYFGPFLQKKQARGTYYYLIKTFRLSLCKTNIKNGCLNYHIGRCAGNCLTEFDKEQYLFRVNLAMDLLRGRYKQSLKNIQDQIKKYSSAYEFEKAKNLLHYEQNLESIFETLKARFSEKKYERDVFLATTPIHKKMQENFEIGKKIQEKFSLAIAPQTIDCFDISHFQSSYIVGSCIRFKHGVPEKNSFRRFMIKSLVEQNDYAALQEIVSRRYRNPEDIPDLIVIDGGKGQLHAIEKIIRDANVISLAKREETIFGKTLPNEGIKLNVKDEVDKLIISLRDYAHHFAVSYHRKRRHMSSITSFP